MTLCNWHDEFSEAETHGFSRDRTYSYSTGWCESSAGAKNSSGGAPDAPAPDILSDVDVGQSGRDKLHLDINLRAFKSLLRQAARRLTVAQFSELRRRYDNVWLEVLEEL